MKLTALLILAPLALGNAAPKQGVSALKTDLDSTLSRLSEGGALKAESAARMGQDVQAIISRVEIIASSPGTYSEVPAVIEGRPAPGPEGYLPAAQLPKDLDLRDDRLDLALRAAQEAEKSNFGEIWSKLTAERLTAPYPTEKVTLWSFFKGLTFLLLDSSRRTLSEHRDILPDFKKLIRPNGVALAGVWEITEETEYTGYFCKGSKAQVIARASSFSDDVEQGEHRSFGMALKLYPSSDAADAGRYKTANVFLIDDNGGTKTVHYTDALLTTHPKLSVHGGVLLRSPVMLAVTAAQHMADKNPDYRQLYPVSELGVAPENLHSVKTPERLLIKGSPSTPRINAKDFRDELSASQYAAGGLQFDIFVADAKDAPWRKIGKMTFSDSVVSRAVDHNLHFPHPRYKASKEKKY